MRIENTFCAFNAKAVLRKLLRTNCIRKFFVLLVERKNTYCPSGYPPPGKPGAIVLAAVAGWGDAARAGAIAAQDARHDIVMIMSHIEQYSYS